MKKHFLFIIGDILTFYACYFLISSPSVYTSLKALSPHQGPLLEVLTITAKASLILIFLGVIFIHLICHSILILKKFESTVILKYFNLSGPFFIILLLFAIFMARPPLFFQILFTLQIISYGGLLWTRSRVQKNDSFQESTKEALS